MIKGRLPHERVFVNRRKEPLTRFGIHALVKRYATSACLKLPSLGAKEVSPHTVRHTTAVHLLRAGVDLNTIRAWLGHVSLDTTNVYAEIDLQMKANALAHCEIFASATPEARRNWHDNPDVMSFLRSL
jgi:site-specific recombinase XerD